MFWQAYIQIYAVLTVAYLWYRFILLFFTEWAQAKKPAVRCTEDLISVMVPFYNEDPAILKKCIESIFDAEGKKEIIVIDDGSPDLSCANMLQDVFKDRIIFCRYECNKGKRLAQKAGFEHVNGKFVVTIDSDTILKEDALIQIIQPLLHDEDVGATTGNVRVLNEQQNILTKMIASRYWNAFNVERKSLSRFGVVTCCSGVLSAYRTILFRKFMPAYTSQKFLGSECTYGDDRHLTNLFLMHGHKVEYVEDAICYTEVPTGFMKFFRQQLRWKKSFIRESLISLTFAFRRGPILPTEVLLNLIIPFWSLLIRLVLVASLIINPALIPLFIGGVITIAVIRNYFLFFENKRLALYSIPYAFVHELVLFWLYPIALFSLKTTKWGTR